KQHQQQRSEGKKKQWITANKHTRTNATATANAPPPRRSNTGSSGSQFSQGTRLPTTPLVAPSTFLHAFPLPISLIVPRRLRCPTAAPSLLALAPSLPHALLYESDGLDLRATDKANGRHQRRRRRRRPLHGFAACAHDAPVPQHHIAMVVHRQ
ncbi:uncharacterized protein Tco025E_10028, partial [Trypanosoma conorhini]